MLEILVDRTKVDQHRRIDWLRRWRRDELLVRDAFELDIRSGCCDATTDFIDKSRMPVAGRAQRRTFCALTPSCSVRRPKVEDLNLRSILEIFQHVLRQIFDSPRIGRA